MGANATRHNLFLAINADDLRWIDQILKANPQLANQPLTDDNKTNAVSRAAYQGKSHIIAILKQYGSDLNYSGESQIPPLFWAAGRGHVQTVQILLDLGADLNIKGPYDFNALDFSIFHGYYNTSFLLYQYGLRPTRGPEEYFRRKESLNGPWVNYEGLIDSLEAGISVKEAPSFIMKPPDKRPKFEDPVNDPNETWKEWFSRVSEFQNPPQVERNSLPPEQQPQNRLIGKMRIMVGWENDVVQHKPECPNYPNSQQEDA